MSDPDATCPLAIPFADSPLLARSLPSLPADQRELVRAFAERGYVVLDLELPDFDRVAERVIASLADRYPGTDRRIDEAWYFCPEVRAVACAPRVLAVLRLLYGREPIPFQTLNFDRGTQQAAHSDTIHFHCVPRHFMCGVWVAFEDVDEENGALFIHPGSHRLPDYGMTELGLEPSYEAYGEYERRIAEILAAGDFERESLCLRKGQAVIWAANAFHGGAPIRGHGRTRHSQATHYYFDDCLYYFPMASEAFAGKVTMREVLDLRTGRFVPHRHAGRELHLEDYPFLWCYERPLPDWVIETAGPTERDEPDGNVDRLRQRVRSMEATVAHLREDNRKQDAFIRQRDQELVYKIARRITKTGRALLGRDPQGPRIE